MEHQPHQLYQQRAFGKKNKPRTEDPSMWDLLTWHVRADSPSAGKQLGQKNNSICCDCGHVSHPRQQEYYLNPDNKSHSVAQHCLRQIKSEDDFRKTLEKNMKPPIHKKHALSKILYLDHQGDTLEESAKKVSFQKEQQEKRLNEDTKAQAQAKGTSTKSKSLHKSRSSQIITIHNPSENPVLYQKRLSKIKKFSETTRWIPNSSFTTYYGKPPFENYGRGNTKPAAGGVLYGSYMFTHNVFPHRGASSPKYLQSYPQALEVASQLGPINPHPPRMRPPTEMTQSQIAALRRINPIFPVQNDFEQLQIKKPDLINSLVFSQYVERAAENQPEMIESSDEKIAVKTISKHVKTNKEIIGSRSGITRVPRGQIVQNVEPKITNKKRPDQKANAETDKKEPPLPRQKLSYMNTRASDFLKETTLQRQKANRLALKVTEVELQAAQQTAQSRDVNNKITKQQEQAARFINLDDPKLDPRNFKNIPAVWMKDIPVAGKPVVKSISAAELF